MILAFEHFEQHFAEGCEHQLVCSNSPVTAVDGHICAALTAGAQVLQNVL